jgi:hypothetical protein
MGRLWAPPGGGADPPRDGTTRLTPHELDLAEGSSNAVPRDPDAVASLQHDLAGARSGLSTRS